MKLSKRRKVAQLPKNLKLILLKNLELLGYPALVRQGSLRVRTKGKLHFKLTDYPIAWYLKDQSFKISLQTWKTFNFSPKLVFCVELLLTHHSYTSTGCHNINQLWSVWFNILHLIIRGLREWVSRQRCFRLVTSLGQRKNSESPWGIEP